MPVITDNILQVIHNLVPAAERNDITCFSFYDNHPSDTNIIDITICTKSREVKEFYQCDLISTIYLDTTSIPTKINILRTKNADLYYLVRVGRDLLILSKRETLKLHKKIPNVERYDVEDITCKGYACLKVLCFDDAVPLIFDDNLEQLQDLLLPSKSLNPDDTMPIITQLQRKLTEAQYSTKCNEKTYKELLNIRHLASYSLYEKFNTNTNDSLYKNDLKEITGRLKVTSHTPWIKTCNGKIVIAFDIMNQNSETLDDIQVSLHGTLQAVIYTTKLFTKKDTTPFWNEEQAHKLVPNIKAAITVVMDLKELKNNTLCKIEFNGFIFFKKLGEKLLLPFDDIIVSSSEAMKEEFNILSNEKLDDPKTILAVLATTKRTDICLRHIKTEDDLNKSIMELFCTYLEMECVSKLTNIIVHRISPYHPLHGIMIVFPENYTVDLNRFVISLYTRTNSQVLTLIHHIYNDVPTKIVITPSTYNITAKIEEFTQYNETILEDREQCLNYYEYSSSVVNRTNLVLQYLDYSIIKMNENKNPNVQSKVGKEIDIFSGGVEKYLEFKYKMLEEGANGVERLIHTALVDEESDDAMIVD